MDEDARTLWCGNLSEKVTEELLYELFLQAAPLERVCIPTDKNGRKSNYGFITVKHQISVDYVVQLLDGTCLYDQRINVKPRNRGQNMQNQQNMIDMSNLLLIGQTLKPFSPTYHQQQNYYPNNRDRSYRPYSRYDNYSGRHNNHKNHFRGNHNNERHRTRFY